MTVYNDRIHKNSDGYDVINCPVNFKMPYALVNISRLHIISITVRGEKKKKKKHISFRMKPNLVDIHTLETTKGICGSYHMKSGVHMKTINKPS